MRRGSLIGPVILILLGGLFLLNNLRPDLSILDLIARGWPYLLIGWGILRLGEILLWTQTRRSIPINGVTGGEWALVVMICLFGSGIFFVHDNRSGWGNRNLFLHGIEVFGDSFDYPLNAQQPGAGVKRLLVENLQGNVHVVGGEGNQITVTGHKTVRAFDKQKADEAARQTPLEVETKDGQVIVRTNQHRSSNDSRISADLEITVPRGLSVECHGRQGDYDISEIAGSLDLDSDRADVRLQNISGTARMDLRRSTLIRAEALKSSLDIKGRGQDIELENIAGPVTINGVFTGELQLQNIAQPVQFKSNSNEFRAGRVPGQVRISRNTLNGNNVVGPVVVNAHIQDVQLSDFTQSLEVSVDRGDLDLSPGQLTLAKISARTHSGNVQLAIPDNAKFELEAVSNKGEVENDFGDGLSLESNRHGGTLRGKVGQGPLLSVVTDRGTLTVRKAGEAAAHPVPPASSTLPVPPRVPAAPRPAPVEQQ